MKLKYLFESDVELNRLRRLAKAGNADAKRRLEAMIYRTDPPIDVWVDDYQEMIDPESTDQSEEVEKSIRELLDSTNVKNDQIVGAYIYDADRDGFHITLHVIIPVSQLDNFTKPLKTRFTFDRPDYIDELNNELD